MKGEKMQNLDILTEMFPEEVKGQADLFADPRQEYKDAIQFYKHDIDWANRLILGDSLEVMSTLARREVFVACHSLFAGDGGSPSPGDRSGGWGHAWTSRRPAGLRAEAENRRRGDG